MTVLLCSTSVEGQLEVARFWSPVCQASSGKTLWLEATVQRGLEPSAGSLCSHIWLSAGTSAGRKTRMTSTGGLATLSLHAWYLDFHTAGRPGSGERGGYAWCRGVLGYHDFRLPLAGQVLPKVLPCSKGTQSCVPHLMGRWQGHMVRRAPWLGALAVTVSGICNPRQKLTGSDILKHPL